MARHREWMAVNDTQQLNCSRGGTSGGPFFFKRPSASVLDSVKREHAPPIKKNSLGWVAEAEIEMEIDTPRGNASLIFLLAGSREMDGVAASKNWKARSLPGSTEVGRVYTEKK